MSLLTQAIIAEKYGVRLTVDKLGEAMGVAPQTIYNQISKGVFPVKTYVEGGKRWCAYEHLAEYFEACRERASLEA